MYKIKFESFEDFNEAIELLFNNPIYSVKSINRKRLSISVDELSLDIIEQIENLRGRIITDYQYQNE